MCICIGEQIIDGDGQKEDEDEDEYEYDEEYDELEEQAGAAGKGKACGAGARGAAGMPVNQAAAASSTGSWADMQRPMPTAPSPATAAVAAAVAATAVAAAAVATAAVAAAVTASAAIWFTSPSSRDASRRLLLPLLQLLALLLLRARKPPRLPAAGRGDPLSKSATDLGLGEAPHEPPRMRRRFPAFSRRGRPDAVYADDDASGSAVAANSVSAVKSTEPRREKLSEPDPASSSSSSVETPSITRRALARSVNAIPPLRLWPGASSSLRLLRVRCE